MSFLDNESLFSQRSQRRLGKGSRNRPARPNSVLSSASTLRRARFPFLVPCSAVPNHLSTNVRRVNASGTLNRRKNEFRSPEPMLEDEEALWETASGVSHYKARPLRVAFLSIVRR